MFGARLIPLAHPRVVQCSTPLFAFIQLLGVSSTGKFKLERHARNFHIRTVPLPRCEKELNRVLRFKFRPTLLGANLLGTSVLRCGFLGGKQTWCSEHFLADKSCFFNLVRKTMSTEFLESPRNISDNRFTVNIYRRKQAVCESAGISI